MSVRQLKTGEDMMTLVIKLVATTEYITRIIQSVLMLIMGIVIISYLGTTFDSQIEIDPSDWRRKFIIFFIYIGIISFGFSFLEIMADDKNDMMNKSFILLFHIVAIVMLSLSLSYIGPTFAHKEIDSNDQRRNVLIFTGYFLMIMACIMIVFNIVLAGGLYQFAQDL